MLKALKLQFKDVDDDDAGRVQSVLVIRAMGVSLITIMGLFPVFWNMPALIITIYLMRTGVNNSSYPIQKAILMDYVPKVISYTCI